MAEKKTFVVYWPGVPRNTCNRPVIVCITPDKKEAEAAAERWMLENGLPCNLLTFHNVECETKFPKKEKENG